MLLSSPDHEPQGFLLPEFYVPHVCFEIQKKQYTIKVADHFGERLQAFELRHRVFRGEEGVDVNHFDSAADLLIIKDTQKNRVVGTYRVIADPFSRNYYSQTEFEVTPYIQNKTQLMEISRACIDPEYRTGATIVLLWQGLLEYAKRADARYLFGCSSVWVPGFGEAKQLVQHFRNKTSPERLDEVFPHQATCWEDIPDLPQQDGTQIEKWISPLLRTYLKAGARVCSEPTYDDEFKCFDFFTSLDLHQLANRYLHKLG